MYLFIHLEDFDKEPDKERTSRSDEERLVEVHRNVLIRSDMFFKIVLAFFAY